MLRRTLLATSLGLPALSRRAFTQSGRVLRVASPFEIGGLDPARSGHVFQRMQVAEPLVGTDEQGRLAPLADPSPVRQLALCYPRDRRVSRAALFAGEVMKEKMIGLVREGTWNGTLV